MKKTTFTCEHCGREMPRDAISEVTGLCVDDATCTDIARKNAGKIEVTEHGPALLTFRCDGITFMFQSDLEKYCTANGRDIVKDAEIKMVRTGISREPINPLVGHMQS